VIVLVLWGLITHGTFAGTGDEPHYLAIAHSMAFDGDIDLTNNYGANEPLIAGGNLQPESHVQAGVGGVARPVHDIGLPLIFAPLVRVAVPLTRGMTAILPASVMQRARLTPSLFYRHLLSLVMIGLTAVLAGLMFDTFVALGGSSRAAFWTALILILSPPLLIFSTLFFTELLSALLGFAAFRAICTVDTRGAARWLLLGLATGFLFLVHAKNIGLTLPLAAFALYALRDPSRRREAGSFAVGLVSMLVLRTAVNYLFWGGYVEGPHARFTESIGLADLIDQSAVRSAGLLVDQEFGLLTYAPLYLLSLAGVGPLIRAARGLAWSAILIIAVTVALIVCPLTNIHGWTGGWTPAARFLTPIVPLLGLFVFAGIRNAGRVVLVPILALQIVIDAYCWQHPKILWNDGDGRAAFCERVGERVCGYLPSLARR
jgi:hypothetical protein